MRTRASTVLALATLTAAACTKQADDPSLSSAAAAIHRHGDDSDDATRALVARGREVFRHDTFGDEAFWGGKLHLHEAIAGAANGGVGGGVSPKAALGLGLKVDAEALPGALRQQLAAGEVNLDDPAVTVALLRLDAVVGVEGTFDGAGKLAAVGITCALCHSTVDNSFAPGIGRRLDGWPNRDLDVGQVIAAAPDLSPFASLLGVDQDTVRTVVRSWGPGKFDAELLLDGKAVGPQGSGATVLPAAFGLAGVNLHTYGGWGSVPYWNAFVANLEMQGQGNFFDPRLNDPVRFPIAARNGMGDKRSADDRITPELGALQMYQLSLPPPSPPRGSSDADAAQRGAAVFAGKAACARCHVPPQYTEPGAGLHTAAELGIDDFQAQRSPTGMYRTTPLGGLFVRAKGGFYHDGRFATLDDVVTHYEQTFGFSLTDAERHDLVEYLKSL